MSVMVTIACSLLIGLSTVHASSNPRLGAQLAWFSSLILVATLSLVALVLNFSSLMTPPLNSPLYHMIAGLAVSTALTLAVLIYCRQRVLFLRRLRGHTVSAVVNTSAAALLASQFFTNTGAPISLLIIFLLGLVFYCVIITLTALREAMRLREAAAALSIARTNKATQDPVLSERSHQEHAHALLSLCVITLCLLALQGAL
jgi:hypothetical protein